MVVRLTTGRRVAGAIRYNERKVQSGQAAQLGAENFGHPGLALVSVDYKTKTLEHLTRRNPRVAQPCLHCALAFHPEEVLSDEQLRRITAEFLHDIGYQTQPYLLYRHHDTAHPHVHVVTVSVTSDGRRIPDAFLHRRVSRIRRRLEQRHGLRLAEGRTDEGLTDYQNPLTPPNEAKVHPQSIKAPEAGHAESLRLLRLVERTYRDLTTGTEPKKREEARACVDELVLRHGVPPPAARRAVELFLANRKAHRSTPSSVEKTGIQPTPSPKRFPPVRRRPR